MPRYPAAFVAILCLALIGACSVYDTYILRPSEVPDLSRAAISGVTTRSGDDVRFSRIKMTAAPSFALVVSDTLYAHVDWWAWKAPLSEIEAVWVRRKAPAPSVILSAATTAGGALGLYWVATHLSPGSTGIHELPVPPGHRPPTPHH